MPALRLVPNSTPEAAMDELLSKARFVFGDQDWSAWSWEAREYGRASPRSFASGGTAPAGIELRCATTSMGEAQCSRLTGQGRVLRNGVSPRVPFAPVAAWLSNAA